MLQKRHTVAGAPGKRRSSKSSPNLFYRSLHQDVLRKQPRFLPLPPEEHIQLAGPSTYKYIRQGTPTWEELHTGLVTTGRLKYALDLHSSEAIRELGLRSYMVDDRHLLEAFQHMLLQAPPAPPTDPGALAAALAANEAARAAYYQQQQQQQQQQDQADIAASHQDLLAELGGELAAASRAVAARGLTSLRLQWGNVHEAAALAVAMQLFPNSWVEEVGLVHLNVGDLPVDWGLGTSHLPSMGASPDAIITHTVDLPQEALSAAGQRLAAAGASNAGVREQVVQELLQAALGGVPCVDSSSDSQGEETDAEQQQQEGQQWRLQGLPSVDVDTSTRLLGSSVQGDLLELLQQAAAAAAGGENAQQTHAQGSSVTPAGDGAAGHTPGRASSNHSSSSSSSSSSLGGGGVRLVVREVVEVKNHCPFMYKQHGSRGEGQVGWRLSGRGPVDALNPLWVPQLQLHMAATGTLSALLVSRCAEQGAAAYRMFADADYQRIMLRLVSHLYRYHVLPGVPPSAQLYSTCKETAEDYAWLLRRTRELAAGAGRVAGCSGAEDSSHTLCEQWSSLSSNKQAWL